MNKTVLTYFTILCLLSTAFLRGSSFNIQTVQASGTIYIRADGSIDPSTVNISRTGYVYTFTGNIEGSIVVERSNILIDGKGYTLQGPELGKGFELSDINNVTIKSVDISPHNNPHFRGPSSFNYGIYIYSSSFNTISNNNITNSYAYGIYLEESSNNIISGNKLTDNYQSIYLNRSPNNTITSNNITNKNFSFPFPHPSPMITHGIVLALSSGNLLRDNIMADSHSNFGILGQTFSDFVNDVDISNSVDGKTVYYWISKRDNQVPLNAGYVILVNCTNIRIENLILLNNMQGILLAYTNYTTILRNNITNNGNAIIFWHSNCNVFFENNIAANLLGIVSLSSSDNLLYHNNVSASFYNHVFINNSVNDWDDDYLSGGNYWSNYAGVDSNHDGIGDSWYEIDENNTDHYPLMGMFSSFNTSLGHHVNVISNSTVEDFEYFESNSTIKIFVSGEEGYGFCRVSIPHMLMNVSNISVVIDDNQTQVLYPNYTLYDNSTHRWIYFAYEHSTHEVIIVPEFPSFLILPLFMITTLLTVIVYRRNHKGRS
ncbi:MAG: right-handed parallel beta-helix repeat-containing protein [Candidatus Bathyarchaeota archaeon]|nr:right-handed parallel beta-helix repeat-containing protein [Candidatus Bathyarchaeota archaeon]